MRRGEPEATTGAEKETWNWQKDTPLKMLFKK